MTSVTYIGADNTTQGSWIGVYGSSGYAFPTLTGWANSIPSGATFSVPSASEFDWGAFYGSVDSRGVQEPGNPANRKAPTWYNNILMQFVIPTGGMRVSAYIVDWDGGGTRSENIDWDDGAGSYYDGPRTEATYQNGRWLTWDVDAGTYYLRTVNVAGVNDVVMMIAFDTFGGGAPTPPPGKAYWGLTAN